ncbi:hypothetical protein fugu_015340 [Takifugu bimaculatus]|uniref:Uncharacterized protein n=1 Tax=Takifugu bimaculatus TaxID=433685 RepID=A0A4Z2BYG6_9TELE|nr:hypothetical protein fugu_015340 [Takifugu bimaculatus]
MGRSSVTQRFSLTGSRLRDCNDELCHPTLHHYRKWNRAPLLNNMAAIKLTGLVKPSTPL